MSVLKWHVRALWLYEWTYSRTDTYRRKARQSLRYLGLLHLTNLFRLHAALRCPRLQKSGKIMRSKY